MAKVKGTGHFEDDVDALFSLPLPEFTGARNALAAQLKKTGQVDAAKQVKALAKPSISAWAVNQLYWRHREEFAQLISTGQSFRKAQTAKKVAGIHEALDARRDSLSHLTELATTLLRAAGHNPSPDTERRITTTLEALSVYASFPDGPRSGRLTQDVDPPGFDSLASLMSGVGMPKLSLVPPRVAESPKSTKAAGKVRQEKVTAGETRKLEEARQKRITAAKASLQEAKRTLSAAAARDQRAEAARVKANAEAKAAEKQTREAEQRFQKAKSASDFASRRAAHAADEADKASQALEDAQAAVEKASQEVESLVQDL